MANASKKEDESKPLRPAQSQDHQPGLQSPMNPAPQSEPPTPRGRGRLEGRSAFITGGDSGIGRAVAVAFAREGADVAIGYLDEGEDARETRRLVEGEGRRAVLLPGDVSDRDVCEGLIQSAGEALGRLDVLVLNAAVQFEAQSIADLKDEHLHRTFATNILSAFYLVRAALPRLKEHRGNIILTTSVTAYRGSPTLVDYACTKGAIVAFIRSLSQQLVKEGVRVNGVAPGPIWTPLIPASFEPDKVAEFGSDVPMKRAGEPSEVAPAYVYLASADASYVTGQVLHVNGGEIING